MYNSGLLFLVFSSILLLGCLGGSLDLPTDQQISDDNLINTSETVLEPEENLPPEVLLTITDNKTSGKVPFYPGFSWNCTDPEFDLRSCEVYLDAKLYASGPPWEDTYPSVEYLRPGEYTITVIGIDGDNQNTTKSVTFTISNEINVMLDNETVERYPVLLDSVNDASLFWQEENNVTFVPHIVNFGEYSGNITDPVWVDIVKEYNVLVGGRGDSDGVTIGIGDSNCYGNWQQYTYTSILELMKHELGHSQGFGHVSDETDIMYAEFKLRRQIDVNETLIAPEGWYFYYPTCIGDGLTSYSFEISSDEIMDFYILPTIEDAERAGEGKSFTYHPDCFSTRSRKLDKTCQLTNGTVLYIKHRGGSAASVSIKMKNVDLEIQNGFNEKLQNVSTLE